MNSQYYNIFTGELPECLQMQTIGNLLSATLRCLPVHDMMLGRLSASNDNKAAAIASSMQPEKCISKPPRNPGYSRGIKLHYGKTRRFFGTKDIIRRRLYSIPLLAGIIF